MTEDFIIEEEIEDSPNRRPFLTAVGVLVAIFVLAAICSGVVLLNRNRAPNGDAAEIAAIETQNAVIAVTNAAVTQTVAAMETEAARPTDTPKPPPTNTPVPTSTPLPTNTPVLAQAEDDATETPDLTETSIFSGETADNTPTPIPGLSGTSGGDGSLPQTGIETWGALVAAIVLIAVFLAARRLRSG